MVDFAFRAWQIGASLEDRGAALLSAYETAAEEDLDGLPLEPEPAGRIPGCR